MTALAWVFAAIALAAALCNWWSRWHDDRSIEWWSKPVTLFALIGVALAIDPADPAVRVWFVAGLAFSLAGDVFLLDDDRWFVAGLASFLVAHLVYTVGFVVAPQWHWPSFVIGAVVMIGLGVAVGARIVGRARRRSSVLGPAVVAYLLAISVMFAAACATRNWWAIVGAGLFVASDSVLGWRQFVADKRWMPLTVMVAYHLGQAGLVISLI